MLIDVLIGHPQCWTRSVGPWAAIHVAECCTSRLIGCTKSYIWPDLGRGISRPNFNLLGPWSLLLKMALNLISNHQT